MLVIRTTSPQNYILTETKQRQCRYNVLPQYILLTKTTTAQTEVTLSYHRVRGLYFLAVIFAATMYREPNLARISCEIYNSRSANC